MTDALIKCGANPKIKPCVHQLWAAYLSRIKIAYCESPVAAPEVPEEEEAIFEEEPSILPDWFSQTTDQGTQEEKKKEDDPKDLLFAPKKM